MQSAFKFHCTSLKPASLPDVTLPKLIFYFTEHKDSVFYAMCVHYVCHPVPTRKAFFKIIPQKHRVETRHIHVFLSRISLLTLINYS